MHIQLTSSKPNYYNYNTADAKPASKPESQPSAKPAADEFVPSSDSGFFTTESTTAGNIKKFAPPIIAGGLIFGTLVGATIGNPLLGAGVGTAFGTVSGVLYGAGRPTGN